MNRTLKEPKSVRCAIYTRKSTEEGLQQEFNSLDAQRDSAEASIPPGGCDRREFNMAAGHAGRLSAIGVGTTAI